jgi:uncharacterized protein (TIGR02391 family)
MVTKELEILCDKEFELARSEAFSNLDRELANVKEHFATMGLGQGSPMAQAMVDAVMARFYKLVAAFDELYLGRLRDQKSALSDADYEWLKAKAESILEEAVREVRRICQSKLWNASPSFERYWQGAEIQAREKKVEFFKKIDILRLQKCQAIHPRAHQATSSQKSDTCAPDWGILHPTVVKVSKSRFESGHFADSVEAALRELNDVVKKIVRDRLSQEFDGADLMNRAFSANKPIISLADLTTQTGRDIQVGYMQIFAGAMTGIRNPKAHANIDIGSESAVHLLYLASLLFFKIEEGQTGSDLGGA